MDIGEGSWFDRVPNWAVNAAALIAAVVGLAAAGAAVLWVAGVVVVGGYLWVGLFVPVEVPKELIVNIVKATAIGAYAGAFVGLALWATQIRSR